MDQRAQTSVQDARYGEAARRFAPAIERLARGYEADPELRRDLVQEIHVALWRSFTQRISVGGGAVDRLGLARLKIALRGQDHDSGGCDQEQIVGMPGARPRH